MAFRQGPNVPCCACACLTGESLVLHYSRGFHVLVLRSSKCDGTCKEKVRLNGHKVVEMHYDPCDDQTMGYGKSTIRPIYSSSTHYWLSVFRETHPTLDIVFHIHA